MIKSKIGLEQHTGSKARISVCMIVRDEAKVLKRCLDSLNGIYDELCVVDTGSVDATLEIAKSFNAIIQTYTKCNGTDGKIANFSAPRNASLEMASGDWILQIDADEILQHGHVNIIKHVNSDKFDKIGVCLSSNGAKWVSCRLFKRMVNASYCGRIHEYLVHNGSLQIDREILIENLQEKQGKESSSTRNIRLCLLACQDDPLDGRNFHYLGNEYRQLQQYDDAITCYTNALTFGNFKVGLFHTAYYLAICYLLKKEWEHAIEAGLRAIKFDPRYAEAYCLLGDVYSMTGNLSFARQWYLVAMTCKYPPEDAFLGVQIWAYDKYPRERLSELS